MDVAVPARTAPADTRVLFLCPPIQDYLADGVFHGLRLLLGASVVEVPRRDFMYASYPEDRRSALYGRGFSLYCMLEDVDAARDTAIADALDGRFQAVVFGDITRGWRTFNDLAPGLERAGVPMIVLDGSDFPAMYPYGPAFWRSRSTWFEPRPHVLATYFKREVTPLTWALGMHAVKAVSPISFSFPEDKIITDAVAATSVKTQEFPSHIVDPEVAARLAGTSTGYRFDNEADYYADLRASRFGITTKKAGWDCLRHYEIAANGAVPCFRHLDRKPARCAPHGLDETNSVAYRNYDDLVEKISSIDDHRYARLRAGALAWARQNTTRMRAEQLLEAAGLRQPT